MLPRLSRERYKAQDVADLRITELLADACLKNVARDATSVLIRTEDGYTWVISWYQDTVH